MANSGQDKVSVLEREVLDEYTRLLKNLGRVGSFV